jgi:hypothetical protein
MSINMYTHIHDYGYMYININIYTCIHKYIYKRYKLALKIAIFDDLGYNIPSLVMSLYKSDDTWYRDRKELSS